jgi:hypothetical protein
LWKANAQEVIVKSSLLFGLAVLSIGSAADAAPRMAEGAAGARVSPRVAPPMPNYLEVGRPFEFNSAQRYGRGRGYGRGLGLIGGGWGGGVYEDPESFRDAGFFAGSADAYSESGRVHYDYDRGYPYDWYREPSARTAKPMAGASVGRERRVSCSFEAAGVRVCRGQR